MIGATTARHGVLLEGTQQRGRLSRVEDAHAGARDSRHVPSRRRRDAAHPLDEVQADPFALQDRPGRTLHGGKDVAGLEPGAVGGEVRDLDPVVQPGHGDLEHLGPGEDPRFAGDEISRRNGRLGHESG